MSTKFIKTGKKHRLWSFTQAMSEAAGLLNLHKLKYSTFLSPTPWEESCLLFPKLDEVESRPEQKVLKIKPIFPCFEYNKVENLPDYENFFQILSVQHLPG